MPAEARGGSPQLYRALGALLCYPDAELLASLPDVAAAVAAETAVSRERREALAGLVTHLQESPLLDLQEAYVELFDRTRRLSLHLYEHVHGDARQRGQAMAELADVYRNAGFELASPELPDYLPVLLEFCSVIPPDVRDALLRDAAPLLGLLASRLEHRASRYAAVPSALAELGGVTGIARDPESESEDLEAPGFEAMDAAWAEQPVEFGLGAGPESCGGSTAPLLDIDPPAPRATS